MKLGRGFTSPIIFVDIRAFINVVKVLYKVRKGSKYKTLSRNKYIKRGRYGC